VARGEGRALSTVLCDLDGTLVDSRLDIAVAFRHAWRTVIGGTPPGATAIAQHIGKPLADMLCDLGVLLPSPLVNAFLTAYRHAYARQGAGLTRLYPGVIATLRALSPFSLGIVTTKEPQQADVVLRRLGLRPFFRHVQGGTPGLRLKPAPDAIHASLTALRCEPLQALMVGDTPADILAGQAAGITTCAVTYGFGRREVLLQCAPDYVIEAFGELLTVVQKSNR
jgi:phosphoglycolate phosphatase